MSPTNAVLVGDFGESKEPYIRWGPRPKEKGQFLGLSDPMKSMVTYCSGVCSKKSITASARLLQSTALLPTGRCHINFLPWKIRPLRCGLSSKFFDDLLLWKMIKRVSASPSRLRRSVTPRDYAWSHSSRPRALFSRLAPLRLRPASCEFPDGASFASS